MARKLQSGGARAAATQALVKLCDHFPLIGPGQLDTTGLSPREAALATAIFRTSCQRWLTAESLTGRFLHKPHRKLQPALRAVLLSAATQLVFMDRLPASAVVDESVTLARRLVRPGAAGMVNAVLRRLARLVGPPVTDQPWEPAADRLPLEHGYIPLTSPCLPDPDAAFEHHLSLATSHPRHLVKRWLERFDRSVTVDLCRHGYVDPPTIIMTEQGPRIWSDTYEKLIDYLHKDDRRRVQDPAAAKAIESTRRLQPATIVDYCAGRGTKTRQLLQVHPQAHIWATDVDADRLAQLRKVFAGHLRVIVVSADACPAQVDLMVLDVPCSNTGVLARRPEARYRFNHKTLASLVHLQRAIMEKALPRLAGVGHVLYSTCSLEKEENQSQARWLTRHHQGEMIDERLTLPAHGTAGYCDGSYYALMRLCSLSGGSP